MNIQTERLENHTARLTVEVSPDRLEAAKRDAVRKIAKAVEIPGFRKGKAPHNLVLRYVGEARVMEDAIEELGQIIYRETLDNAEVKPYGQGALEEVKVDPLTFIYTVSLQPSVELGEYRSIRLEYTPPVITDADVERALKSLQDQEAISEESQESVAVGDRITVDVHSFFVEEDHDEAEGEAGTDDIEEVLDAEMIDADEDDDTGEIDAHHDHEHTGDPYIHEHDVAMVLREGDDEPMGPGFVAAMLGANIGDTREFVLVYPTKEEKAEIADEIAGRSVEFVITVKKIENVTLPEMDDEFAAKFTDRFGDPSDLVETLPVVEDEVEVEIAEGEASSTDTETPETEENAAEAEVVLTRPQLTLEQLRERVREALIQEATSSIDKAYSDRVLDEIVNGANVAYPEEMLDEQLDSMIENLDQRLRQQGISLEMYQSLTGKTRDDLRNDYREQSEAMVKRSLVLFEVAIAENLQVAPADFEAYVDATMQRLGFASPEFRKTFDNPSVRENIYNRIIQDKTFEWIAALGKGTAPEVETAKQEISEEVASAETADSVQNES